MASDKDSGQIAKLIEQISSEDKDQMSKDDVLRLLKGLMEQGGGDQATSKDPEESQPSSSSRAKKGGLKAGAKGGPSSKSRSKSKTKSDDEEGGQGDAQSSKKNEIPKSKQSKEAPKRSGRGKGSKTADSEPSVPPTESQISRSQVLEQAVQSIEDQYILSTDEIPADANSNEVDETIDSVIAHVTASMKELKDMPLKDYQPDWRPAKKRIKAEHITSQPDIEGLLSGEDAAVDQGHNYASGEKKESRIKRFGGRRGGYPRGTKKKVNKRICAELETFYREHKKEGWNFVADYFFGKYDVPQESTYRLIRRLEREGTLKHKPRSGRPKKFIPDEIVDQLVKMARDNINLSIRTLARRFNITTTKCGSILKQHNIKRLTAQQLRQLKCALEGKEYTPFYTPEEARKECERVKRRRQLKRLEGTHYIDGRKRRWMNHKSSHTRSQNQVQQHIIIDQHHYPAGTIETDEVQQSVEALIAAGVATSNEDGAVMDEQYVVTGGPDSENQITVSFSYVATDPTTGQQIYYQAHEAEGVETLATAALHHESEHAGHHEQESSEQEQEQEEEAEHQQFHVHEHSSQDPQQSKPIMVTRSRARAH